jgi:hypothetical protein
MAIDTVTPVTRENNPDEVDTNDTAVAPRHITPVGEWFQLYSSSRPLSEEPVEHISPPSSQQSIFNLNLDETEAVPENFTFEPPPIAAETNLPPDPISRLPSNASERFDTAMTSDSPDINMDTSFPLP